MTGGKVDIAIAGETPLAGLLAGLLASRHGRKVALTGTGAARYRLARGFDLSVAPVTRPETWALIGETRGDVLKLLSRIGGKAAARRVDALFCAETAAGKEALGHMQVLAATFGEAVEPLPEGHVAPDATAFRLRDAAMLDGPALAAVLTPWLAKLGVQRDYDSAELTVLADDDAVLAHATTPPPPLAAVQMTALLTEPAPPLLAPLLFGIDRGVTLVQGANGGVAAIAAGPPAVAVGQIGAVLARGRTVRRAGQAGFSRLAATDGAPVIGRLGHGGPLLLCGLEPFGAFIAPAIARFIAGEAGAAETAWFTARATSGRAAVADYAGGVPR